MKAGRWFDDADMRSRAPNFVINDAMAKRYWPGQNVIGQRVTVTRASQARPDFGQPIAGTIIGVINDVHQQGQDVPPDFEVYVPFTLETWPWGSIIVRSRDGQRSVPALARAIRSVDSRLIAEGAAGNGELVPMESMLASTLEPRKLSTSLVGAFALCALLLAAIGMYGVVAYGVARRTQEIGVRKAVGATDREIMRLMLGESLRIVVVGIIVGALGSWAGARLIRTLLFETGAADPLTYVVTIAVLGAVAMLATYLPARTATRLSPTMAMRSD
jgi:ABC-type antimicrobial peptide transport system permease subunit